MRMRGGGGEEEEREDFHESLDRILSSSCSSTSVSDDESMATGTATTAAADGCSCSRNHRNVAFPSTSASVYDVWASEPSSVEERRKVLLQRLGLIGDPSLCRPRSVMISDDDGNAREMGRSFTYPRVSSNLPSTTADAVIPRSRSDPHSRRKPSAVRVGSSDVEGDVDERLGLDDDYCTIKNLDSGVEFVVNELREDGMWNKLREVGTGKQFTMEEFRSSVIGRSPIVEELMRRQNQEECCGNGNVLGSRAKKRGSWLKSIRNMADNVVNGGETRLSSATDDSQDFGSNQGSERVKVRQYGKSWKELTGLYMNQEIHAHSGSIWTIKFSLDGRHLATAGEDCVIHVWRVVESERKRDFMEDMENESYFNQISTVSNNGSPELTDSEKTRRAKLAGTRKSFSRSPDHVIVPDNVFELSDKPVCSFVGHQEDVLDLSWSKSKLLLSSSMDRTVKLWDMFTNACLKTFVHSDYVTCIHFNPVDDRYFISGSIDAMVRLWSIEHHQVVDWDDLREMVTAACYTPNGQGAFVGSQKGDCNFYNTSDNKLQQKSQVNFKNKKKKSNMKRITGFQFGPSSSSQVLVTSADPQIRVIDDLDLELVHKFKGFRNKSSQISASITADGNHVVCASDSQVYIWRYDANARPSRSKAPSVGSTHSYEHFNCRGVSVAVAWSGESKSNNMQNSPVSSASYETTKAAVDHQKSADTCNLFYDRISATWPEEKLISDTTNQQLFSPYSGELINRNHSKSVLGMVIVTAGRGGEIKIFQNFG